VTAELLEAAKASLPVKFVEDGPPLVRLSQPFGLKRL
jgi:hypothetical protein